MIKGVIFDVDGVLLNSMPVWENLGELYLNSLGLEAEKDLGEILFTMSLEEGAEYLITQYGIDKSVEEVVNGLNREVRDFYAEKVPLKEGVRQYLSEFRERGIPMVIATSGDRKNTEAALRRLKVLSYFQGIYTCSEIGIGKDQPDIYFAAALQLDTEPGETWVFEDAFHALRTAHSAGFKTVAVYDKSNDRNLAQIWNTADIYLPEFKDFNIFWKRASQTEQKKG
ncbi:MAG: HAD family phosphatase [Mediterraneibacter sp.]